MVATILSSENSFDENCTKYKCCFGCMHSRLATIVFAVIELSVFTLTLIIWTVKYLTASGLSPDIAFITYVAVCPLYCIATVLSLYSIHVNRPRFLLPYMFIQVVCISGLVIGIVITVMAMAILRMNMFYMLGNFNDGLRLSTYFLLRIERVILILLIIYSIIKLWILIVVIKCYRYIRARLRQSESVEESNSNSDQPNSKKVQQLDNCCKTPPQHAPPPPSPPPMQPALQLVQEHVPVQRQNNMHTVRNVAAIQYLNIFERRRSEVTEFRERRHTEFTDFRRMACVY